MSQNTATKGRVIGKAAASAAIVLTLLMALGTIALAQTTITVNSLADPSGGGSGNCTLRDGMNVALGNSISPDTCSTNGTGAPFTIVFSKTGTITLASTTLPKVTGITLTITGPTTSPADMTIDGGGSVQLMRVAAGATLNLQNLTLAHGNAVDSFDPPPPMHPTFPKPTDGLGGAIYNEGTVTIGNCTFSANQATTQSVGIFDEVLLNISSAGGAIFNGKGTVTATNSTFSANEAAFSGAGLGGGGGAILNDGGTLTATNCTFSANQAIGGTAIPEGTGGLGQGGAIFNVGLSATITITNTTFSANQAIGGLAPNGGAAWVRLAAWVRVAPSFRGGR
jgi:hypothetical protein